jgi:hypothetical protein
MGIVLSWMGGWIPQGVHPIDFWGGGAPGPQRKQAPAWQGSPAGNACADLVFFPNGVLQSPPSRGTSLAPVRRLARLPKLSRSVGGAPGFWLWDWQRAAAARLRAPSAWGVFGLCQSLICWRGTRPAYRGQSHKLSQAGSTPAPATNFNGRRRHSLSSLVTAGCVTLRTPRAVSGAIAVRTRSEPPIICSAVSGKESPCRAVKAAGAVCASDAGGGLDGCRGSVWHQSICFSAGPAPHLQAMAVVPISRASGPADVSSGGAR